MGILETLKVILGFSAPSQENTITPPPVKEDPFLPGFDPDVVHKEMLFVRRSPRAFYHSMLDEEFVAWLRNWSDVPVILTPEDREILLDRVRIAGADDTFIS